MKASAAWLAVTVPVFALSVFLLTVTIRSLIRTMRGAVVATVPLRDEQTLTLGSAGKYELYGEGKLLSRDFGRLDFTLTDSSGTTVPLRSVWLRTHSSSFSRVRLLLRRFTVATPGQFTLRVQGMRSKQNPESRLVFSRAVRAAGLGHTLAIVALALLIIGSLVGSLLLIVLGRGPTPPQ